MREIQEMHADGCSSLWPVRSRVVTWSGDRTWTAGLLGQRPPGREGRET